MVTRSGLPTKADMLRRSENSMRHDSTIQKSLQSGIREFSERLSGYTVRWLRVNSSHGRGRPGIAPFNKSPPLPSLIGRPPSVIADSVPAPSQAAMEVSASLAADSDTSPLKTKNGTPYTPRRHACSSAPRRSRHPTAPPRHDPGQVRPPRRAASACCRGLSPQ